MSVLRAISYIERFRQNILRLLLLLKDDSPDDMKMTRCRKFAAFALEMHSYPQSAVCTNFERVIKK